MLSYFRLHARSVIVKTILAVMAVGLAFFYGYSSLRKSDASKAGREISINGKRVSASRIDRLVEDNAETYRKIYQGKVPDSVLSRIRAEVTRGMVRSELLLQWGDQIGIPVSPHEVGERIVQDPNFLEDNTFRADYYKARFRPWFAENYGVDYETMVRESIALQKIDQWLLSDAVFASEQAGTSLEGLSDTLYHLKRIHIDPARLSALQKNTPNTPITSPEELAKQVLAALPDSDKAASLLKPYEIAIDELKDRGLDEWQTLIPPGLKTHAERFDALDQILALSKEQPVLDTPIEGNGHFYLYQLVDISNKKTPSESPDLNARGNTARLAFLEEALASSLTAKANIDIEGEL